MDRSSKHALVAMGANLPFGDLSPAETLAQAVAKLGTEGFEIIAVSRFFATPCFPAGAGPDYVNAAVVLGGEKFSDATSVLAALHRTEAFFGRKRAQRWGMRTLDLDLLALDQVVLPDSVTQGKWRNLAVEDQPFATPDELILPHPRLQDRGFVLAPLAEIAPEWQHPLTGQTVLDMLAALPAADRAAVVPLEDM